MSMFIELHALDKCMILLWLFICCNTDTKRYSTL